MLNEVFNIIKMIDLVKHRPGIYDFSTDEHNNRANVESLWKEVAEAMGTTPAECRRKWASLRNALSRDLRNEREASLNKRKKKKWYLAEHLHFLRHHLNQKTKDTKGVFPADESMEEEVDCPIIEENKNIFDFSTQDVLNEYLSAEETNDFDNKSSFASVSSSVVNETKHIAARPPPPPPSPHKIMRRYINKSVSSSAATPSPQPSSQHKFGHYINDSVSSSVVNETQITKLAAIPPPPQPPRSPHKIGYNFMNESNIANISRVDEDMMLDDRNMTFFKSIIPDILRLSERKQRLYKQNVIMKLNRFLDEQET